MSLIFGLTPLRGGMASKNLVDVQWRLTLLPPPRSDILQAPGLDSLARCSHLCGVSVRKRSVSRVSNWRRPLPRPIVIPRIMTLETLEDVRALVHRHLPAEYRSKQTWQRVAAVTTAAARGEQQARAALARRRHPRARLSNDLRLVKFYQAILRSIE
jgi:hypothetical protein